MAAGQEPRFGDGKCQAYGYDLRGITDRGPLPRVRAPSREHHLKRVLDPGGSGHLRFREIWAKASDYLLLVSSFF